MARPSVRETVNWFQRRSALGLASTALALTGVVFAVQGLVSDQQDQDAAARIIPRDGFTTDPESIEETIGGGTIDMPTLSDGRCTFDDVSAQLVFRHGKVVNVVDYQIPLGNDGGTTVTVQNAAQLQEQVPGLHCQ